MMVTGSSILGRRMLGPNTVARFWTLILFSLQCDWTSSRNLRHEGNDPSQRRDMEETLRLSVSYAVEDVNE